MEKLSLKQEQHLIEKTTALTIAANVFLSMIKITAGTLGASISLVSDGWHSFTDAISTLFVFLGARISRKEDDATHPYGHERFEALLAFLMGLSLVALGVFISYQGILQGFTVLRDPTSVVVPSLWILGVAVFSIILNETLFWWAFTNGKKAQSTTLVADAWHHRFDALSSIGSVIGIGGALLGFPWLEPLAALFIGLMILKVAFNITLEAIRQLVDEAPDLDDMKAIEHSIHTIDGVQSIDDLKGRRHASKIYIDVEIGVNESLTLKAAHTIAEAVHHHIEASHPRVKHCMVHVNPRKELKA